ncbi:hypothetical protein [Bradyrhizobium sp. UFLA05-153]
MSAPLAALERDAFAPLAKQLPDPLNRARVRFVAVRPAGQRYDAADLLNQLGRRDRGDGLVLALTDVDLAYPGRTFVFGTADAARRLAVVSLFRLRPEPPDNLLLLRRLAKETAHELGHACGLGHCADPDCVMRFSRVADEIDQKGSSYCSAHRGLLQHSLF